MTAKTLRALLEKAAMRWYRSWIVGGSYREIGNSDDALYRACKHFAAALKRKRTGRR